MPDQAPETWQKTQKAAREGGRRRCGGRFVAEARLMFLPPRLQDRGRPARRRAHATGGWDAGAARRGVGMPSAERAGGTTTDLCAGTCICSLRARTAPLSPGPRTCLPVSPRSLTLAPRPDGWLRVSLPVGTEDESEKVTGALAELLQEAASQRYLVSRQACAHGARTAQMRTSGPPARPGRRLPCHMGALVWTQRTRLSASCLRGCAGARANVVGGLQQARVDVGAPRLRRRLA